MNSRVISMTAESTGLLPRQPFFRRPSAQIACPLFQGGEMSNARCGAFSPLGLRGWGFVLGIIFAGLQCFLSLFNYAFQNSVKHSSHGGRLCSQLLRQRERQPLCVGWHSLCQVWYGVWSGSIAGSVRIWAFLRARFWGKVALLLSFTAVFFLVGGQESEAWGPGVHMVTGNWLLQNLTALPVDIAASIMAHPGQFLYGILSPDIFIGKGSMSKKGHSHNWQTGLLLLRLADTAEQQAYAYGYLSHLSADTVAHNVFVPQSSEAAVGSGRLAHVYLEMQADRVLDWDSRDALAVFRERPSAASAALLQKTMRQTPWTFWMKKFLFKQSIFFGGLPSWRSAMGFLDSVVVGPEGVAFAEQMLVVSTRAMVSLLQDVRNSPVRTLDPIGAEALEGFRGQSRNIIQSIMENLFPGLMQKHWANALFYSDTCAPQAEKNFSAEPEQRQNPQANEQGGKQYGATEQDGDSGSALSDESSHGVSAEDMAAYLDETMTEKIEFLHGLDKGSPIIEEGFSLPDVLKNLPPVCVP